MWTSSSIHVALNMWLPGTSLWHNAGDTEGRPPGFLNSGSFPFAMGSERSLAKCCRTLEFPNSQTCAYLQAAFHCLRPQCAFQRHYMIYF